MINGIINFAESGFWEYRGIIGPAAALTPLAIEGALFAKNVIQKPEAIKEKINNIKKFVFHSFTPQENETSKEAILRITKNIFLLLFALGATGAIAFFSITLLPSSMGISVAIAAVFFLGKFLLNANEFIKKFTIQPGEDPKEAQKRIIKCVFKIIVILAITAASIAAGVYIIKPLLHTFVWQPYLPFQTKPIVFLEYAAIGVLHLSLSIRHFVKGDVRQGLFHLFAAVLSLVFPSYYWNHDMRLHHSAYGLLMMAIPSRPIQFLGSLITFDAGLYMLSPMRGYAITNSWGWNQFIRYDFINTISDNFSFYTGSYAASFIGNQLNKEWDSKKESHQLSIQSGN